MKMATHSHSELITYRRWVMDFPFRDMMRKVPWMRLLTCQLQPITCIVCFKNTLQFAYRVFQNECTTSVQHSQLKLLSFNNKHTITFGQHTHVIRLRKKEQGFPLLRPLTWKDGLFRWCLMLMSTTWEWDRVENAHSLHNYYVMVGMKCVQISCWQHKNNANAKSIANIHSFNTSLIWLKMGFQFSYL